MDGKECIGIDISLWAFIISLIAIIPLLIFHSIEMSEFKKSNFASFKQAAKALTVEEAEEALIEGLEVLEVNGYINFEDEEEVNWYEDVKALHEQLAASKQLKAEGKLSIADEEALLNKVTNFLVTEKGGLKPSTPLESRAKEAAAFYLHLIQVAVLIMIIAVIVLLIISAIY